MKKNKQKLFNFKKTCLYVLFLCAYLTSSGQSVVKGTTKDATGAPLPGVNILEKGTQNVVMSDFDGNFSISLKKTPSELEFTSLGFKTQEKKVLGGENLKIQLIEVTGQLDEVVVVGYGTSKKKDLTGATASVTAKDFDKQPLSDASQALQGRAAGVQVTQTSGAPGGAFKIRIRGANSITGGNEPLYVVDGQFVDISTINVNDIQSMEVLKDASSTAIYGTRGANGVILISTKKGKSGKAKISLDYFTGIANVTQELDLMNAAEFAEGVNFAEGTGFTKYTAQEIEDLRINGGEDWQKRLFQTALTTNVQIAASGGSENMDYYISGNYYGANGTIVNQDFKRLNLRSNLNAKVSDNVKMGLNFNIGREENTGSRANIGSGLAWDPTTPAFDSNGNYNFFSIKGVGSGFTNPLIDPENITLENLTDRISFNGYVNWDITKNLVFNTSAGIAKSERHLNTYRPRLVSFIGGEANVDNGYTTNLFNTNRLTYSLDINENNKLKIDGIHELVQSNDVLTAIDASSFFTDVVTYRDLSAARIQMVTNSESNRELESFLVRANYTLFNKYLLTASFRADGTSVFQNNKFGYFPSAALAWKVSEENFIKKIETIDNLKLRLSYGQVGNQGIDAFGTRNRAVLSPDVNYPFSGSFTTGVAPSNRVANPDLTWETTEQINAGFDVGLFKSALTLSFDYYKKNTTNLLLDTQLPEFVGPTRKFVNAGEVENQGFDINLGIKVLENKDWNINSGLTLSRNRNKVLALNDNLQFLIVGNFLQGFNPTRVEVGLPISTFRGYVFEGVYQLGEEAQAAVYNRVPGQAKYKDSNGDNKLTADDVTTIGNPNPDFTWGWNWDLNYKNWNLNFLLTGSQGNDIYNIARSRLMAIGGQQFHAVHADYNNRWTPTNPSNIPSGRNGTEAQSSQFVEDGSYTTMKNIALSYNFDKTLLKKLGLSNARIYGSVENLFILTPYSGFDPEATASTTNQDADVGIDYNTFPLNRTVTFGLNFTF